MEEFPRLLGKFPPKWEKDSDCSESFPQNGGRIPTARKIPPKWRKDSDRSENSHQNGADFRTAQKIKNEVEINNKFNNI
jgi:hypothetical protein